MQNFNSNQIEILQSYSLNCISPPLNHQPHARKHNDAVSVPVCSLISLEYL
jgi:hypothetical protein